MMGSSSVRPRLTVAILARDAEQLLVDTLATASQIADEIIVCDTGSVDGTRELALRYGAQVLDRPWNNSFAEARNAVAEAATGDWLLWLDAGETISTPELQPLRTFIDSQANLNRAYLMVVMVPPAPGMIAGEQIARVRLVPNIKHLRFTGRVRETLKPALASAGIGLDGLPWRIHRGDFDNTFQVKYDKSLRDLKLLDLAASEQGQTPALLVSLGECLTVVGDTTGSQACFRKALQMAERGSSIEREAYYGLLTALDASQEERQQQIAVCLEALDRFPLDAQLLCAMGGYMQSEGRIDMATRAYQTAFEYGQIDPEIWHVPDIFDIAAACLSLSHQLMNNDDSARQALESGLARNPSATRLRRQLIDLHVQHDRRKEALAEFDLLPAETPNREALRSAIRGACLAARQNWVPALAYLQTAYKAGCRDALCLRWLSTALISTGDRASALDVLTTWQMLDSRNAEVERMLEAAQADNSTPADSRQLRFDEVDAAVPAPKLGSIPAINLYGPPVNGR